MKWRNGKTPWVLSACLAVLGCKEEAAGDAQVEAKAAAEKAPSRGEASSPDDEPSGEASKSAAPSAEADGAGDDAANCPAGTYGYDYSDGSLEQVIAQMPGAEVKKAEGELECVIEDGKSGTLTCESKGGAVHNVIEAKQAGMAMVVDVKISGKAVTNFTIEEEGKLSLQAGDLSGLDIQAEVTMGGNRINFPVENMMGLLAPEEKTQVSYACEGDRLQLTHESSGKPVTQTLVRK